MLEAQLPSEQDWLVNRMLSLGYVSNRNGVCFGLSHMALQAILIEDFHSFYRRLQLINKIPVENFPETIATLKTQRINLVAQIKFENSKIFENLNKENLEKDPAVKKKIKALNSIFKESNLNLELQTLNFEKRKNEIIYNAFIQNKINEALLQLPEDERLMFDIPNFFEGIELYQQAYLHPHLFPSDQLPLLQDAGLAAPLALSKILEEQGGYTSIGEVITGIYDKKLLTIYFDCFRKAIECASPPITEPITILLNCSDHAILISFNKGKWKMFDPAQLNITRQTTQSNVIASKIITALSTSKIATFSSTIYGPESLNPRLNVMMDNVMKQADWQTLHTVTPTKARLKDSDQTSWLYIAAREGQLATVKSLLIEKADPNLTSNGISVLTIAAQMGHRDIVRELLTAGADPNLKSYDYTSLIIAATMGHVEIVKELLSAGANPNLVSGWKSPLNAAVRNRKSEVIKELLFAGADPNMSCGMLTPLFIAAKNGDFERVKILLADKRTDPTLACTFPRNVFLEFSQKYKVEKKLSNLINLNANISKVSLTPADIAFIMGHEGIATLLNSLTVSRNTVAAEILKLIEDYINTNPCTQQEASSFSLLKKEIASPTNQDLTISEIFNAWKKNQYPLDSSNTSSSDTVQNMGLFSSAINKLAWLEEVMNNFAALKPNQSFNIFHSKNK